MSIGARLVAALFRLILFGLHLVVDAFGDDVAALVDIHFGVVFFGRLPAVGGSPRTRRRPATGKRCGGEPTRRFLNLTTVSELNSSLQPQQQAENLRSQFEIFPNFGECGRRLVRCRLRDRVSSLK
jgi:hypothetical protein